MNEVIDELKIYFEDLNDEIIIPSFHLENTDIDETQIYYIPIPIYDETHHGQMSFLPCTVQ
jgi:hypothetical protein